MLSVPWWTGSRVVWWITAVSQGLSLRCSRGFDCYSAEGSVEKLTITCLKGPCMVFLGMIAVFLGAVVMGQSRSSGTTASRTARSIKIDSRGESENCRCPCLCLGSEIALLSERVFAGGASSVADDGA